MFHSYIFLFRKIPVYLDSKLKYYAQNFNRFVSINSIDKQSPRFKSIQQDAKVPSNCHTV